MFFNLQWIFTLKYNKYMSNHDFTFYTYHSLSETFVPLVESGICLLVDVATLSTIYDVRLLLLCCCLAAATNFVTPTLQIFRLFRYSYPSSSLRCSLVASARLCCLSRVPPAVCPSLL